MEDKSADGLRVLVSPPYHPPPPSFAFSLYAYERYKRVKNGRTRSNYTRQGDFFFFKQAPLPHPSMRYSPRIFHRSFIPHKNYIGPFNLLPSHGRTVDKTCQDLTQQPERVIFFFFFRSLLSFFFCCASTIFCFSPSFSTLSFFFTTRKCRWPFSTCPRPPERNQQRNERKTGK